MFQPDHLPQPSFKWANSEQQSSYSQQRRRVQVLEGGSRLASELKQSLPADLSANKRAVIERLIELHIQGATS